jgi:ribosomal protein S18 acetylase RimI-like enzyme
MTIEAGPDELFTTLARDADLPAIVALINAAYRGAASRRGWTSEADLIEGARTAVEDLAALIRAEGNVLLLIRGNFALNGCVHLERRERGTTYIGMLSVRPAMQGSLIGRNLLSAAERYAREHFGATRVELTVLEPREELIAWYERRGYTRTGETRPFPYDNPGLGTPSRDDLRFVVMERALAPSEGVRVSSATRP